jgi:class 3 adenylate cyclase/CHASE2 domain-containing sensor protein
MALGLAATLAALAAHFAGLDRWVELGSLDWRFRNFATAPPGDEIVNVNIDDRSLDEIGRWPWPREQLAGVVDVLFRCGARAVALDIILPEPQEERYRSAGASVYDESGQTIGGGRAEAVFDDQELAQSIAAEANRIFLPMFFMPGAAAGGGDSTLEPFLDALVARRPTISLAEAQREAEAYSPGANRDPRALRRAYLRARAMNALRPLGMAPSAAGACRAPSGGIVPPLVRFVEPLRHTGFVTVDPESDGVVRRIPLMAIGAGRVFPQFALAVAAHELGRRHGGLVRVEGRSGCVRIELADGAIRDIPVDEKGYMLINWMAPREGAPVGRQAPIWSPGNIHAMDLDLRLLEERKRLCCLDLVKLCGSQEFSTPEFEKLYWEQVSAHSQLEALYLERMARTARAQSRRLFEPAEPALESETASEPERLVQARLDAAIPAFVEELSDPARLDHYLGAPAGATRPPTGDPRGQDANFAARRREALSRLDMIRGTPALREELLRLRRAKEDQLRQAVEGRICLVGSTATGAADFVPTPMDKRTPGPYVHANILNTILSGRFVRPAHWALDAAAILLAGMLVTWVTATRPALHSGPLTILLGAAYAAFAAFAAFREWDVWLAMVAPLATMALSYAVVTAWRQLTEERARRHIRGLFAHALSPALVDRLTEDPSLLKLGGEKRVLSCFFSDLEGFTPLSERLGERETVRLLNRYFDRMTEVIQSRHGGYLNKFMGDGMFVFFGAPVLQDDHAARAVRSAAECLAELEGLNRQLAADLKMDARLACRIGVATGEVMVGNCGSTGKFDYTAIGDTVNLASRLEGANKFFGTRALVSAATWGDGVEGIVARPLGGILVVGKAEPVAVWNILGRERDLPAETVAAAGDFARGVGFYASRDFAAAAGAFQKCLAALPHDQAAELYLGICRRLAADPPPADWKAAIRLTEK